MSQTKPVPARGSIASTIASITTLRRNTISNEPMWRCSSRTAIAMAVNDSTAPPIHRAPRSRSGDMPVCYGLKHEEDHEPQARHLSAHLPARVLRADEEDRRGQPGARRAAQALDAHPGAVGPRAAHQDDEALPGLQADPHAVHARGRVSGNARGDAGARPPRQRRHVRDRRRSTPTCSRPSSPRCR